MKLRWSGIMVMVCSAALFTGCATTGDLEKLQLQVTELSGKVDQTAKEAQAAKAAAAQSQADCAKATQACSAAAAKAEQSAAQAAAAAKLAEDNAKKTEAIFMKSMKK